MPYWQLFYHIVTATKERMPVLTPAVESKMYGLMKSKVYQLDGALYAINGTLDHMHLVVSIPPKISVAEFVGQIKGFSTAQYNRDHPESKPFFWQTEYGVFSFDKKRLSHCVAYVERQKEHHQNGSLISALERWTELEPGIAESAGEYMISTDFID